MKSKAGNKLKKIRKLTVLTAVTLAGCIADPKTIHEDYEVPAACLSQPDSTTWSDTTQVDHFSCTINPRGTP